MNDSSLRVRKKIETKVAIVAAAKALFTKKGYQATTLSEIAEHANVSPRTIFSYFPSKEAIIFDSEQMIIDSILYDINNRGDKTVFDVIENFNTHNTQTDKSASKHKLVSSNPQLQDYLSNLLSSLEGKLTREIADERRLPLESIELHLVAASLRALISYNIQYGKDVDALNTAFKFMKSGLDATTKNRIRIKND